MFAERIFYVMLGVMVYLAMYVSVGLIATGIWKLWAKKKVGEFWEYTLLEGLRAYHPDYLYFIRFHNVLYSVVYVGFWPIMVPFQMTINTKMIRKMLNRGYHF